MNERRYPDAQVAFESVLQLDAGHAHARELLEEAARRTGEALFARWLPNQEPTLALFEEPPAVVEAPSLVAARGRHGRPRRAPGRVPRRRAAWSG